MKTYPSSITKEQFKLIEEVLEGAKKHTKPRKYKLFHIFNALLYIVKTGTQWRSLPHDFPDYRLVHYYFREWSREKIGDKTILEIVLKKNDRKFSYSRWQKNYSQLNNNGRSIY
jgi:transposase